MELLQEGSEEAASALGALARGAAELNAKHALAASKAEKKNPWFSLTVAYLYGWSEASEPSQPWGIVHLLRSARLTGG